MSYSGWRRYGFVQFPRCMERISTSVNLQHLQRYVHAASWSGIDDFQYGSGMG